MNELPIFQVASLGYLRRREAFLLRLPLRLPLGFPFHLAFGLFLSLTLGLTLGFLLSLAFRLTLGLLLSLALCLSLGLLLHLAFGFSLNLTLGFSLHFAFGFFLSLTLSFFPRGFTLRLTLGLALSDSALSLLSRYLSLLRGLSLRSFFTRLLFGSHNFLRVGYPALSIYNKSKKSSELSEPVNIFEIAKNCRFGAK